MNRESAVDDPWRRLPFMAGLALFLWGAMMYAFALLLGHMWSAPDFATFIDAQLMEEGMHSAPAPPQPQPESVHMEKAARMPTAGSKLSKPKPLPGSQSNPMSVQQSNPILTTSPSASPPLPLNDPPSLPATIAQVPASTPVTLPDERLPPGNVASPDSRVPAFETRGSMPPAPSTGSAITPPLFSPAYLNNPRPVYPPEAKRMGMEGMVMLKVLVSREGSVLAIDVARSSGYEVLDRAASEAVRKWRFVPACRGNSPIDEWVHVPLTFHLKK